MAEGEVRVFRPKSLGGLLRLYSRNPDSLLFAGGTELMPDLPRAAGSRTVALPPKVIYLGNVPELARISRTQRFLDIGAGLSLARILSIGRNVLPRLVYAALSGIASPSIRNLATLGGNLCAHAALGDSLPALSVIRAQLELRSLGSARWVAAEDLFRSAGGRPDLHPGELVCRVRLPLGEWDFQVYRKLGSRERHGRPALSFAGLARVPKGILEAVHFGYGGLKGVVFRSPEMESRLRNSHLPEPARLIDGLLGELDRALAEQDEATPEGRYRRATALRLLRWFLQGLNAGSLELP